MGVAVGLMIPTAPTIQADALTRLSGCSINVAHYGHTLTAAEAALSHVTRTCRTLVFPAGTYTFRAKFKVDLDSITLSGQPGAVIQPTPGAAFEGAIVEMTSTGDTVSGLTVVNAPDKGIEMVNADDFTVSNNVVHGSGTLGIQILRSTSGTVSGNTIYQNQSNGIDLHGATYVTVENNEAYLDGSPYNTTTHHEGEGIEIYCSQHLDILSNTIYDNSQGQPGMRDGIRAADTDQPGETPTRYVTISKNTIYDNQKQPTQGYAINLGGVSAVNNGGGDLTDITVTYNTGHGNIHPGIFTEGLAPDATYHAYGNKLTGRFG